VAATVPIQFTLRTGEAALLAFIFDALVAALCAAADLLSAADRALEEGDAVAHQPNPA